MDNKNRFEELELLERRIKELFKTSVTDEFFESWGDCFDVVCSDKKHVFINYHGMESFKDFKNECFDSLRACICSAMGDKTKIKISEKKGFKTLNSNVKKNIKAAKFFVLGMIFVCFALASILVMCNYIGNRNFKETFYNVSSIKVDSKIRVIQLSDLHGCLYGENNKKLTERINSLKPDVIICTGDMVNNGQRDDKNIEVLCGELAKIAPSYYIYGNNEVDSVFKMPLTESALDKKFGFNKENRDESAILKISDALEEKIEKTGMKVLKNEKDTIDVGTTKIDVYGILNSNPSSFWSYSEKSFLSYLKEDTDNLKITAIHEPFIFEEFQHDFWGDLMLSGHTHGGVMRIPVIGPLYTNEGGLFPERSGKFVYGRYNISGGPLIVSGGMENVNVLRLNNQPELVVIDINKF